jgi:hypothetical protein
MNKQKFNECLEKGTPFWLGVAYQMLLKEFEHPKYGIKHKLLVDDFKYKITTGNYGENFTVDASGYTLLQKWGNEILTEEPIGLKLSQVKLSHNTPEVLPIGQDTALHVCLNWLAQSRSELDQNTTPFINHLQNVKSWLESLGADFTEYADRIIPIIRKKTLQEMRDAFNDIKPELIEILQGLQAPVGIEALKKTAIADGSSQDDMFAYIDALRNSEKIGKIQAKELKAIVTSQGIGAVLRTHLRNELKKEIQ